MLNYAKSMTKDSQSDNWFDQTRQRSSDAKLNAGFDVNLQFSPIIYHLPIISLHHLHTCAPDRMNLKTAIQSRPRSANRMRTIQIPKGFKKRVGVLSARTDGWICWTLLDCFDVLLWLDGNGMLLRFARARFAVTQQGLVRISGHWAAGGREILPEQQARSALVSSCYCNCPFD